MGLLKSLLGGGSSSSQSTATTATQTTNNNDASQNAGSGSIIFGEGATYANDISAPIALASISAASDVAKLGFAQANKTTQTAFDYLGNAGTLLTDYIQQQSQAQNTATIKNQELTANLAQRSYAMGDPLGAANDKLFSIGKMALYIGAGIAALFLLIKLFKKQS
jgi:hypothetical protein